jgi:hypothetical protein
MSVVTRRIYHISAASTTLLNTQMGVEDSADGDLGFRMWCGRDDVGIGPQTGTITKFLAKDRNARVISLTATSRVLVTSGADITASAAAFTPSGDFDVTAGGDVDIDATGDVEIDCVTATITATTNVLLDVSSVFRVDVGGTGLLRIAHDGITPDIIFNDYHINQNFTQHYCALCNGGAEAIQYVSDFGEVSIFAALHACLTGGVSEPDKQIVWGTGPTVDSSAHFTFDDDYDQLRLINNHNETNWYDANAASILLQGTATQGNAVVANGDLTIGSLHSSVDNAINIFARNDDSSNTYKPSVNIKAEPSDWGSGYISIISDRSGAGGVHGEILMQAIGNGGESSYGGNIIIDAHSDSSYSGQYDHELVLKCSSNVDNWGLTIAPYMGVWDCPVQFKNACWGTATTATWTGGSNDIAANFSTGKDLQFNGNVDDDVTSLSLTAPTGGDVKGMVLLLRNSEVTTIDVGGNGGGSGWDGVLWSQDGVDLASSYVTVDSGGYCQIMLEYVGSIWFGSVTTFSAVPA